MGNGCMAMAAREVRHAFVGLRVGGSADVFTAEIVEYKCAPIPLTLMPLKFGLSSGYFLNSWLVTTMLQPGKIGKCTVVKF